MKRLTSRRCGRRGAGVPLGKRRCLVRRACGCPTEGTREEVSLRVWVVVAALTGLAVAVLVAPIPGPSDAVFFALVAADFVAIGLIAGDVRALWAAVAYATCVCVDWYVVFFATGADSGILDSVVIGLFAWVIASAADATGYWLAVHFGEQRLPPRRASPQIAGKHAEDDGVAPAALGP